MKSSYAVFIQIMFSATNFLVFFIFTKLLDQNNFVFFSTSVGVSIMAYAIAEGGISYIAPKILSYSHRSRKKLTSAFVTICIFLYVIFTVIFFNLWNFLSDKPIDILWMLGYSLYFSPVLLMPSWLTAWSIKLDDILIITFFRLLTLVYLYLNPTLDGLIIVSTIYMLFLLIYSYYMNKKYDMFSFFDKIYLILVLSKLREVFLSKTITYFVYSSIPLVIASNFGSSISASYILGERIKSLYSTLFQPIIQVVYLWQFQSKVSKSKKKNIIFGLIIINITILICSYIFIQFGYLNMLGKRFNQLENIQFYIWAAFISINTSLFLYFKVLPDKLFSIFRNSAYFQMFIFIFLFIIVFMDISIKPAYILLIGELSIFISIAYGLFKQLKKENLVK